MVKNITSSDHVSSVMPLRNTSSVQNLLPLWKVDNVDISLASQSLATFRRQARLNYLSYRYLRARWWLAPYFACFVPRLCEGDGDTHPSPWTTRPCLSPIMAPPFFLFSRARMLFVITGLFGIRSHARTTVFQDKRRLMRSTVHKSLTRRS